MSVDRVHFDCVTAMIALLTLFFIFITVSFFLLVELLFVVAALVSDNAARWNGRTSPCQEMTRKRESDLKQARARPLTRSSNQTEAGGAWLRNAGPRHTSGVKTQSRGLARRKVSLGGAANTC